VVAELAGWAPTAAANAHAAAGVHVRGLGKTFRRGARRTVAFSEVQLDVAPGEFVCILGPSGCGKSTLLRVLAGILAADSGSVTVDGRRVTGPDADRGMLFQRPMLFPWLTTRDNVLFGPRAQRSRGLIDPSDEQLRAEVDSILRTVGLLDFADAYPHELSGGMQHRAAFARALITRPSVLFMDEPFGALDALTRLRMQQFLLEMWQRYRLTIVFVTHDIEEAVLLADRVVVMGGSPAGVVDVIDVDLNRPRDADSFDAVGLHALKQQIRKALR
jgi:NitT/TauT family transport system ATP-binding protein